MMLLKFEFFITLYLKLTIATEIQYTIKNQDKQIN